MKFAFTLIVIILNTCDQKINITGKYSKHFTEIEIGIILNESDPNKVFSELVIGAIEINKKQKVGLYFYKIYNRHRSIQVIHKVLKFEDKLEFPSGNIDIDISVLQDFEKKYSKLFSQEQFKKIKKLFIIGTEISGRVL